MLNSSILALHCNHCANS